MTMKAITVRQPWAWAIAHGGKTVENRSQAFTYRGTLAIHAGHTSAPAAAFDTVDRIVGPASDPWERDHRVGAIVAVTTLVDAHVATAECCPGNPWAERPDQAPEHRRNRLTHLVLTDTYALDDPIPNVGGKLGLWSLTPVVGVDQIDALLAMYRDQFPAVASLRKILAASGGAR
ncbi:hypothetical protein GCM10022215_18230 [Nocardioides fonticola]|uniref:ASCH domain-containing protein n=1 Tax=Nocardioides fonticola TaxID=450363 RepID=A0ABP7XHN4_9ACTN